MAQLKTYDFYFVYFEVFFHLLVKEAVDLVGLVVRLYVTNVLLSPPSKDDWIIASEASNKNKAPEGPKF